MNFWLTLVYGAWLGFFSFALLIGLHRASAAITFSASLAIIGSIIMFVVAKNEENVYGYLRRLSIFWGTKKGKRIQNWLVTPTIFFVLLLIFILR